MKKNNIISTIGTTASFEPELDTTFMVLTRRQKKFSRKLKRNIRSEERRMKREAKLLKRNVWDRGNLAAHVLEVLSGIAIGGLFGAMALNARGAELPEFSDVYPATAYVSEIDFSADTATFTTVGTAARDYEVKLYGDYDIISGDVYSLLINSRGTADTADDTVERYLYTGADRWGECGCDDCEWRRYLHWEYTDSMWIDLYGEAKEY